MPLACCPAWQATVRPSPLELVRDGCNFQFARNRSLTQLIIFFRHVATAGSRRAIVDNPKVAIMSVINALAADPQELLPGQESKEEEDEIMVRLRAKRLARLLQGVDK